MQTLREFIAEKQNKIFVLVMGGAGAGKNYHIAHDPVLKTYNLIDIDIIKKEPGMTNAMMEMKKRLQLAFEAGVPVAHPTVGGSAPGNINKLKLAKKYGYKTQVIFLRGSPEKGITNIRGRTAQGGHHVPDEKVNLTYDRVEAAFKEIYPYADESHIIDVR